MGAFASLLANPVVGALSDRTTSPRGRRHPWTIACALTAASWAAAPALLTSVLPAATDRAKDMGLINIAYSPPLVVAPLLAGVVLGLMNSYPALFALAGVVTVIAAATVTRVRSAP
jgi:MFS family permease